MTFREQNDTSITTEFIVMKLQKYKIIYFKQYKIEIK